ncbi:MAG: hypothetical protein NUW01_11725 [Gemmatimonadaceae bacterium]|nr:hypothetical protein [Gemmatimonadaceae bacterium]
MLLHPVPIPSHPVPLGTSATRNGRAILFEPTPQEVAVWWESLSPLRSKADTGTAVRRFRAYARKVEPELLWYALGEVAVEGLPAHYFTEQIARERIARIREVLREEEKREELEGHRLTYRGRLRSIGAILGSAA